jgi:3-isopropylmalate dehydratase small subunit
MSEDLPTIEGDVWRFGDDIDTDIIIPWEYAHLEPEEYAQHVMEPADESFAEKVTVGDVVVAGANFGSGSSREHAPIALKKAGIGAVVAESFGRIFYRNAINQGLPVVEIDREDIGRFEEGDEISIDLEEGTVVNQTRDVTVVFDGYTEPVRSILAAGGAEQYYS